MTKFAHIAIAMAALLIALAPSAASDPKPDAKEKAAQEKAVKELVGKAVTAIAKRDIEAIVEMSDVPWCSPGLTIAVDKAQLKRYLKRAFDEKPEFDPKYTIRSIANFKEAKRDLPENRVDGFGKVLADSDYVVVVEITYLEKKIEMSLLIKQRDGKFSLVGFDA